MSLTIGIHRHPVPAGHRGRGPAMGPESTPARGVDRVTLQARRPRAASTGAAMAMAAAAAAVGGPAGPTLAQRVKDLQAAGVRFYLMDGRPGGASYTRLDPPEAVEALEKGPPPGRRLATQADGMDDFVPFQAGELGALEAFYTGSPGTLEPPGLALALARLRDHGLEGARQDLFTRRIGIFGAWQALTGGDPADLRIGGEEVATPREAEVLAFFRADGPLPDLADPERARSLRAMEQEGFTFHVGRRELSAYGVWRERPRELQVGLCGRALQPASSGDLLHPEAFSPEIQDLRGLFQSLEGMDRAEAARLVQAAAEHRHRWEDLKALRRAEERWGTERGTPSSRAADHVAFLEEQGLPAGDLRDLLAHMPAEDARRALGARADLRDLARVVGDLGQAEKALPLLAGPAERRVLARVVALERRGPDARRRRAAVGPALPAGHRLLAPGPRPGTAGMARPESGPVTAWRTAARRAVADLRLVLETRRPGQTPEQAVAVLEGLHRALAGEVAWEEVGEAFRFVQNLADRPPEQALRDLLAAYAAAGDLGRARRAVEHGPTTLEVRPEEIVVGGVRLDRRRED